MNQVQVDQKLVDHFKSRQKLAWIVAVIGILAMVASYFLFPDTFFPSYLIGWVFWVQVALGALVILMIQNTVGGRWGLSIQRVVEAATQTLPLLAVLFIVIIIGIPHLYEWSHADVVAHDELLQKKEAYLNVPFFIIRSVIYFAIWIGIAWLLRKWSVQLDENPDDESIRKKLRNLSAPGILIFGFTVTFASVDWMMSLEPHWYSTIYGIMFGVGAMTSGFAFSILILMKMIKYKPWSNVIQTIDISDLGNWLLASIMLWAYVAFSQFLIIWSANLPEETTWYLHRTEGGWQWVAIINIFLHFFLPFFFLLVRGTKKAPGRLKKIALLVLVMRFVDLIWMIYPVFSPEKLSFPWGSIAAWLGIGGLFMAIFLRQMAKVPVPPLYDPRMPVTTVSEEAHGHVS